VHHFRTHCTIENRPQSSSRPSSDANPADVLASQLQKQLTPSNLQHNSTTNAITNQLDKSSNTADAEKQTLKRAKQDTVYAVRSKKTTVNSGGSAAVDNGLQANTQAQPLKRRGRKKKKRRIRRTSTTIENAADGQPKKVGNSCETMSDQDVLDRRRPSIVQSTSSEASNTCSVTKDQNEENSQGLGVEVIVFEMVILQPSWNIIYM